MPNKEFKMLGKEEIKEQAILRGMQNGRQNFTIQNLNSAMLNTAFKSKMALMVKTDICFHSCIWLSCILDHGLVQHPQILSLSVFILF